MTTGYKIEDLAETATTVVREASKELPHLETCPRCGGDGSYKGYSNLGRRCFKCDGKGKLAFKKPAAERKAARDKAAARKANKAEANLAEFKVAHPDVWAWMDGSSFQFAVNMVEAIRKYGDLTPNQLAACKRAIAKRDEAKAAQAARLEAAPVIDLSNINAAFDRASSKLKGPKLTVAGYRFSFAPAHSANAGSLYVKHEGQYLGKITAGKFLAVRTTSAEAEAEVIRIAADPRAAAVEHGKLTGQCSVCNRPLTNPASVAAGIGPICGSNFFGM